VSDAPQPRELEDSVGNASEALGIEELGVAHSDTDVHEELRRAREKISSLEKQVKELQERGQSG